MTIRSLTVIVPAPGVVAISAPYGPSAGLLLGTSESAALLGTGPQSFVMEQFGLSFQAGVRVRMSTETDPVNTWMEGVVTSYVEPLLSVAVDLIHGTGGSYSEWNIGVTGQVGQQGIPGAIGPVGPTGPVNEAPLDGVNYGRNNAIWKSLDVLYIREAPTDGHNYGRKSANWTNIDTLFAGLVSPAFTGTPTAPTQPLADNSTKLATTAYADRLITPTGGGATLASPAFTGTPTAPTVVPGSDTSTKLATTAFVQSAIASIGGGIVDAPADNHNYARKNNLWNNIDAFFSGFAPLASPAFTGVPTAPTPAAADSTTKLATTAFVTTAVTTAIQSGLSFSSQSNIVAGSFTYTTPADSTTATVYRGRMVAGGGGGGGTASGAVTTGSCGGAGEFKELFFTGLAPGTAIPLVVGAAGAAGTVSGSTGGNGGNTTITIGGQNIICNGGAGGLNANQSVSGATINGGNGGTGGATPVITGVTLINDIGGQNGGMGSQYTLGPGGSTPLGSGGQSKVSGAGVAGTGSGSGGGAAWAANSAGGAGASGAVLIERIQG